MPLHESLDDPSTAEYERRAFSTTPEAGGESEQLIRSIFQSDEPGTDPESSLQLISGLDHLYLFRPSRTKRLASRVLSADW